LPGVGFNSASDDGGVSWQKAPAQLADSFRALAVGGARLWSASDDLFQRRSGGKWTPRLVGEKVESLASSSEAVGKGTRWIRPAEGRKPAVKEMGIECYGTGKIKCQACGGTDVMANVSLPVNPDLNSAGF
jgi:hypothetical protein